MLQPRSLRVHLTLIFLVYFSLTVALGVFCASLLRNFNTLSADVAGRWLPNTRVLGDLNNLTSDFRAIEGANLLSSDLAETVSNSREMERLDRAIAQAERSFEQIRHDPAEDNLYAQFRERWNEYRAVVNQMLALARDGSRGEGTAIYKTTSRSAYGAASDALGSLTDTAVANAQAASDRLAFAYQQAVWLISIAIAAVGILVVGALVYIRRSISAPLLHLADQMHRLAASDVDIDTSEIRRRDEIGEMARATVVFRDNAIKLIESQRTLAEQASILKEQLAQEQHLSSLQRNFVSMVSHEFRTPLNVIDGHAQRLIKTKDLITPKEIGERANKLRVSVARITNLIDNLLGSARLIESGDVLHFEEAEIDLTKVLREVTHLHREISPDCSITETFNCEPIIVKGDQRLLFQLFSNLVSNAVKYSPDGGLIEVRATLSDGAVVEVSDRGIGIPEDDIRHLFQRYHRGSNVSGIVGTGVGLFLVKLVVDRHGGSIDVSSQPGEGTRFVVRLPLGQIPREAKMQTMNP